MPQKTSWFSQYSLDYPNRDPDKISFYVVGWISIALLGMCMMFADIAAGVLLIVFLGVPLTGGMLWEKDFCTSKHGKSFGGKHFCRMFHAEAPRRGMRLFPEDLVKVNNIPEATFNGYVCGQLFAAGQQ